MWVNSTFFIILGFFHLIYAENNKFPDEQSIIHVDVQRIKPRSWKSHQSTRNEDDIEEAYKVKWSGNGDFYGSPWNLESEVPSWDSQPQIVNSETGSIDIERSSPSSVLQPPFEFYSSSINDFANDDSSTVSSNYDSSSFNSSAIKTLRIYEITKSNSSWGFRNENEITTGRSFAISDPSSQTRFFDSLRSVIKKKNITRVNSVNRINDGNTNGLDNSSSDILSRTNVIRANSVKANALRGNRKYQPQVDSDETSVRRHSWGGTTQRYNGRRRPVNRANHVRLNGNSGGHYILHFHEIADSGVKVGAVPGVAGRDYPVHQEHAHYNLRNAADRFPCPTNPLKHFYIADRASRCQIFYVCYGSETGVPMVCPNGTLFNQEIQVCDWWFNVIC